MPPSEAPLKHRRSLARGRFITSLGAIAEECSERIGAVTIAQSVARQLEIPWFSIEMTTQEKLDSRIPSDDIREEDWIARLLSGPSGPRSWSAAALIARPFLETVPQILQSKGIR